VSGHDLLVTGTSGFVGRWVVERAGLAGLSVRAAEGDLRDPAVAERVVRDAAPSAVIHAAAAAGRRDEYGMWRCLADDIAMAGSLLRAVADHAPGAAVLMPGSAAQYGLGMDRPLREDDPTTPVSGYGAVKCVLEQAVLAKPLRAGVRVIWARSFNHVGPRQGLDAPLPQWARQIAAAERAHHGTLRAGRLDVVRDFLDVRDVSDAYIALVRAPDASGPVNVCSGEPTPLRTVVEMLLAEAKTEIVLVHDPALERRQDPPEVVGDPSRLRALTGWSPALSLADSIRDLLREWRATVATSVPA
jgi:GDP-4-dehydro-6-deoxy-D-mannose reductase